MKQLVFVFLTCCVGAAFFQSRDKLGFMLSWDLELDANLYSNGKFPLEHEKMYDAFLIVCASNPYHLTYGQAATCSHGYGWRRHSR